MQFCFYNGVYEAIFLAAIFLAVTPPRVGTSLFGLNNIIICS